MIVKKKNYNTKGMILPLEHAEQHACGNPHQELKE